MQVSSPLISSKGEAGALISLYWVLCLPGIVFVAPVPINKPGFLWIVLFLIALGAGVHLYRLLKLVTLRILSTNYSDKPEYIICSTLHKHVKKSKNTVWMGSGFLWSQRHSAKLYETLYAGETEYESSVNFRGLRTKKEPNFNIASAGAMNYLQTLNQGCYDIKVPLDQFKGHTLLLATTRAIKTRFLSLLVIQALFRSPGEAIIVIDPKGDLELKNLIEQQAKKNGGRHFEFFHPAFPEQSVSLNPLQNFNRPTEIASRIVDLVVKGENDDAFSAFAWRAINVICTGLIYVGETPTILSIKNYIDNGVGGLLSLVLEEHQRRFEAADEENVAGQQARSYLQTENSNKENVVDQFLFDIGDTGSGGKQKLKHLIRQYKTDTTRGRANSEINDLIAFYQHDRVHASKMLASLVPLLSQLSSGSLGKLLSPPESSASNVLNFADVVDQRKVIYIGLDSMADSVVGSAIGQVILADIAAVAAKRYNFNQNFSRVNLFIDEAHSICNKSLLTLANQGAGAGIDLCLASQTLSDFVVALGSEEHALKLLGNLNNLICGRIIDPWTQTLVVERFGKTHIEQMMRSQSESSGTGTGLLDWGSSSGERVSMVETDLVPASVLGRIPNLEYFALLASGSLIKGKIPVLQDH